MCILRLSSAPANPVSGTAPAQRLLPEQRRQLAGDALAGRPITQLAQHHQVSRKFVYQQLHRGQQALDQAFQPPPQEPADLLFWLPVTKPWLEQLVLGLLLICHSSYRGVGELLADLFDYPLGLGSVQRLAQQAAAKAHPYHQRQDLRHIRHGALDELFQGRQPILVGVDVASTYCFLLSLEEHRDAETWGVRLLELAARGFQPAATIADGGSGLRAGQALALPGVPCHGDVFHALQEAVPLVTALEKRAYDALATCQKLEQKQAQTQHRQGRPNLSVSQRLRHARVAADRAVTLADEIAVLVQWLRQDLLAVAGPDLATRRQLYDWVLAEWRAREAGGPRRLRDVRRYLEQQRDVLLAFAEGLDQALVAVAAEFQVPAATARAVLHAQARSRHDPRRWPAEAALRQQLGERFHPLSEAVAAVARHVVRASSVVENYNSRLRNYFFLRRSLGPDYLALLQFFLNHRRFQRSAHPEREGKSPAELLSGQPHAHWLELLGYRRFTRS